MAFNSPNQNKVGPEQLNGPEENGPEGERSVHSRTMPLKPLRENRRFPTTLTGWQAETHRRNLLLGRPERDRNPYERPKLPSVEAALDDEKRIRREIANSNERRRMQGINDGIEMLLRLLPAKGNEKLSKAAVLHNAAEHVYKLEQEKKVLREQNARMKEEIEFHHLKYCGDPLYKRRMRLWQSSDSREDACDSKEILHLRRQIALEKKKRRELEEKINNLESCFYGEDLSYSGQPPQACKKIDFSNSSLSATELDPLPVARSPIYNGVIRHGSSSSTVPVSSSTTNEISSMTIESSSTTAKISSTVAESSATTPECSSPASTPESSFCSSLKDSDPSPKGSVPLSEVEADAVLTLETMKLGDTSTRNNIALQANSGVARNCERMFNALLEAVKVTEGPNFFHDDLVSSKSSSSESVNVIQCVKNGEVISSVFDRRVC